MATRPAVFGRGIGRRELLLGLLLVLVAFALSGCYVDPNAETPRLAFSVQDAEEPQAVGSALQLLILLSVLSLAPAALIMMTSFTRIVIVLSLLRQALGLNQTPPNQVLIGLSLFLSFFLMAPVVDRANAEALQPYMAGEIGQEDAVQRGLAPLREFMLKQTREKDIALFLQMGGLESPENPEGVPTQVLMPAFLLSELKTAFQMGFVLFIPCLVIDMVVASILMSMGMMMLPPVMISLPFKLLLFVLVDGWYLVVQSLLLSFT
jgi:flagellar biosynthesis protein FliP